ncbi:hypothetical protein [Candidatus Deianiraea vastatrix]|uniref:Uncharacterized protein n=1 Tax=Candidatus Deianiraea vastatrix TaxID=2163644 RepID=A0A5B8XIA2_9RICK|nr:hypothetical protein [Candidatus Deianiraea vastatrix]QED23741.1 hypothetical protein Deia_00954 [Candidatus Deianiraea vastatrix]
MKVSKNPDNIQFIDLLTQVSHFSNKQINVIINVIKTINDENKQLYATKLDLKDMENRLLKRIIYLFAAIQTIMTYIIKILAF